MIITRARVEDLDSILALEQDGFEAAEQWSADAWAQELAAENRWVLARTDQQGAVVGVATFGCVSDMADLHRVIVRRGSRGQGIGASLVRAGLDWAQAVGATRMLLEVNPGNTSAVELYSRLGFDPVSTRRDYYGPGKDAMVMLRPVDDDTDSWAVHSA